jgi:hypothetical protein
VISLSSFVESEGGCDKKKKKTFGQVY